jgi:uncharacterized protein
VRGWARLPDRLVKTDRGADCPPVTLERMHAERIVDLAVFAERTDALLGREPVVQTQLCSLVSLARRQPDRFEEASWFVATSGGTVVGAAAQVPPFALTITPMPDRALAALADVVAAELPDVPGVAGPRPGVGAFAGLWRTCADGAVTEHMAMRLFRCDAVSAPAGVPGELRRGGELPECTDLFERWVREFVWELEAEEAREPEKLVQRLVERDGLWVWCDGGTPVSFANTSVPAYEVTRLGLVYTPAELRGRGYAGACVAEVSRRALAGGLLPVLFTDLANSTSNHIYQQIGYRSVADAAEYSFAAAGDAAKGAST